MTNTLEQDIQEALGAVHDGGITISTGSTRQADDIRETLIWALDIAEDVDKLNARIKELEEVHKAVNNWFYNTLMPREDICIPALVLEELDNILNKGIKK